MTASTDNKYQEDNFKLYGRARQVKNNELKYSATVGGGRICCSTKDDNKKKVKARFPKVPSFYEATTVRRTVTAAAAASTVTPTSSSTKNEQTENTVYAFYYYQITGQDRNCNCYICSDLAAFKPKQNDAIVAVGGFAAVKKQSRRRAHV